MTPYSKAPWTNMGPYIYSPDSNWPIAQVPQGKLSPEQQDANLRFITHAPDLEESLVEMIAAFDKGHTTAAQCVALGIAKKAIGNAGGSAETPPAITPPPEHIPQAQRHLITKPWAVGNILTCTQCGIVFYSVEESRAFPCSAASANRPTKDK